MEVGGKRRVSEPRRLLCVKLTRGRKKIKKDERTFIKQTHLPSVNIAFKIIMTVCFFVLS